MTKLSIHWLNGQREYTNFKIPISTNNESPIQWEFLHKYTAIKNNHLIGKEDLGIKPSDKPNHNKVQRKICK